MNLARILGDAAAAHGARPALLGESGTITYAELERRAGVAAAILRERGVHTGDRVAIRLPNGSGFVAAYFGALKLGAIAVPLNLLLAPAEIEARIEASTPRLLVEDELDGDVDPLVGSLDLTGTDPAVILFTSGTSDRPKGAILTHGSLRAAAANAAEALRLGPGDVMLGVAPFSHVLGQSTGILSTFLAGAAINVAARFDPEAALEGMAQTRTTILLGVPTMCIALCEAARTADELPPIRIAHVGGAAVPVEVARAFEAIFGGEVYEGYGLTELSGVATTYVHGQERKPGSVGMPLGGTELRIVSLEGEPLPANEIGEAQFRGPSVIPGYWEDPDATAAAIDAGGWFGTGDVGYVDDDGYLFLVDRRKELIIRGGYNVYPREVEEVLYTHPAVLEAAVVGVPDERLGEEVAALVVPRPGTASNPDDVAAWVKERVAAYKYPRRLVFVDELPKGPTGKILKRAIDRSALGADPPG
ncbi:MAG TPA: AMP-binding protein [Gaiellaceae bacterium]|nr:AMP-binding protein [Gaiellaceae bacterium]